jgi:hypothetical protein
VIFDNSYKPINKDGKNSHPYLHSTNGGTTRDQLKAKASFQTTSFLDATILIYAIGAGITAAAGTRLALQ